MSRLEDSNLEHQQYNTEAINAVYGIYQGHLCSDVKKILAKKKGWARGLIRVISTQERSTKVRIWWDVFKTHGCMVHGALVHDNSTALVAAEVGCGLFFCQLGVKYLCIASRTDLVVRLGPALTTWLCEFPAREGKYNH